MNAENLGNAVAESLVIDVEPSFEPNMSYSRKRHVYLSNNKSSPRLNRFMVSKVAGSNYGVVTELIEGGSSVKSSSAAY